MKTTWLRWLLVAAMALTGLSTAATASVAQEADTGLVAWYPLDQTSGTSVRDASGNGRDASVVGTASWRPGGGFEFTGGASSSGNAIELPDGLTRGLEDMTLDFDVNVAADLSGFWFMLNLGTQQAWPNGNGYLFLTGTDVSGKLRGAIAEQGFFTEQSATAESALPREVWKHITYAVDGGTLTAPGSASLYVDGQLVARNDRVTTSPARLGEPDGATDHNWLGRSAYPGDASFKGAMRDVRIYDRVLTTAEMQARLAAKAQEAVDAVQLVDTEGVRGNMTLPTSGAYGAQLDWTSSRPGVVSPTGIVVRPATGSEPVAVDLTVTATLNGATASRTIGVTVLPAPAALDLEGYAFSYFTGESSADSEKIFFSASRGNDPLAYDELNGGRPVLTSTLGERGLRDPSLIRSHEGDKFWLLATDLRIFGGNDFAEAQESGSKHLMVWESTDLVNWSEQRMVKVSSDFAGNTWAPESFYDEATGEYVVYWASNLYPTTDVATRDFRQSYNRMMYATTRDFRSFSEARPWVDVQRGAGRGMIDATVVRDGDTFYRFIKDEASFTVRQERSTDLKAVVTGTLPTATSSPWSLVKERIGVGQPNPWGGTFTEGEGPTVFRDNELADRWYMLIDQPSYHGGQGYLAFRTDDIASGTWTSITSAALPASPRHGTVLPVTAAELDRLVRTLSPDLVPVSSAPVAVVTTEGTAPQLPPTVPVVFADGQTRRAAVTWDATLPAAYADWGRYEVQGTLARSSSVRATAQVTVRDAAAPVAQVTTSPATPDGLSGWFTTSPGVTATATDEDSGVASVELSVDGGAWSASTAPQVLTDGRHSVRARATDRSGHTSTPVTREVQVDAEGPVSRADWDAATRTLSLRGSDSTSGLLRIEHRRDGEQTWSVYTAPLVFDGQAATVHHRAVDVAGNVEPTSSVSVPAAQRTATTTRAVLDRATVKQGAVVRATVQVTGGTRTPTGVVDISSSGTGVGSGTLSAGSAVVTVDSRVLGVGSHVLTVRYGGDAAHAASQTTVTVKVTK